MCTWAKETYYYLPREERSGEMLFAALPEIEIAEADWLAGGMSADSTSQKSVLEHTHTHTLYIYICMYVYIYIYIHNEKSVGL